MEAAKAEDPEKPPGLPSRAPLWIALFLALPAAFSAHREVWIVAIAAIGVFCLLARKLPRKRFARAFQILGLITIFGSCATIALSMGIYGSAIFGGSRDNGGYYLDKSNRFNPGPHLVGVGPAVYYGVYLVESTTFIGMALFFAVASTLHPQTKKG